VFGEQRLGYLQQFRIGQKIEKIDITTSASTPANAIFLLLPFTLGFTMCQGGPPT